MRYVNAILILSLLAAQVCGQEPELIWQDGQWVSQAKAAEGTPEGELSLMRQYVDRDQSSSAIDLAKAFPKKYPGNSLNEEMMSLAGQAELRRGHYYQAFEWYEKQIKAYPNGPLTNRALDREMQIAQAFLAGKKRVVAGIFWLDAKDEGIQILQKVAEHAPSTLRAETALLTVGDFQYDRRYYRDAADAYDTYLKLFPNSPRSSFAEFRAADSLYRAYRGPDYDDTTLVEAEQRFKTFLEHHPAAGREWRVDNILAAIHVARGEKQMVVARFYERTKQPKAALFYYRQIALNYSDTPIGADARAAVGRLSPSVAKLAGPVVPQTAQPTGLAVEEETEPSAQPLQQRPSPSMLGLPEMEGGAWSGGGSASMPSVKPLEQQPSPEQLGLPPEEEQLIPRQDMEGEDARETSGPATAPTAEPATAPADSQPATAPAASMPSAGAGEDNPQ